MIGEPAPVVKFDSALAANGAARARATALLITILLKFVFMFGLSFGLGVKELNSFSIYAMYVLPPWTSVRRVTEPIVLFGFLGQIRFQQ